MSEETQMSNTVTQNSEQENTQLQDQQNHISNQSINGTNNSNNEVQNNKTNDQGDQIDKEQSNEDNLEEQNDELNEQQDQNLVDEQGNKLSKNQLKRQKRAEMWESIKQKKKEMKKEEKEKKKLERQQQMIENNQNYEEMKKQKQQHNEPYKSNQQLRDEYSNKAKNGQPIILDMQFLDKLEDKEFKSLVKQLCYMQSSNRKAANPCRFMITSCTPKLRKALIANHADKWGIEILDSHYLDLFPKENLVYLTGDTDQDLDELDKSCAYIIGGLVDHNRLKNVTFNAATEQGLNVKRFPIQNHLKLEASSILACNHVFDIMVKRANGESWKDSLTNSIPIRKIVATVENGVETPTEHYLKKLEQMKKQQEEALEKKKLLQSCQDNIIEGKDNKNEDVNNEQNESDEEEQEVEDDSKIEQEE